MTHRNLARESLRLLNEIAKYILFLISKLGKRHGRQYLKAITRRQVDGNGQDGGKKQLQDTGKG